MTSELLLQIIIAISTFCNGANEYHHAKKLCMKKIYNCSYNTKKISAIPARVQRCTKKYVNGELK